MQLKGSWKTTTAGIVGGLVPIIDAASTTVLQGKPLNWTEIGIGVALVVLGALAKDHDKTGGSRAN